MPADRSTSAASATTSPPAAATHGHRFTRRQAGGHDILDHQHLGARVDRETAAQFEGARRPLDENRRLAQRATHFMPDDDAAHCRATRTTSIASPEVARQLRRERDREPSGALGVHQHARALEVIFAVTPRREQEMPLEQGVGGAEFGQDFIIGHGRIVLLSSASPIAGDRVLAAKICLPQNSVRDA